MEKISISLSYACVIILFAIYHIQTQESVGVSAPSVTAPKIADGYITFVEGDEAEPPAWSANLSPPKKIITAVEKKTPGSFPQSNLPLRRIAAKEVTFAKTQEGIPIAIIWNR